MDITKFVLDDGRVAEKRTSIDDAGNEVVEIYVEERKPLKLEHKISRNPIVRQIEQEDISKMIASAIAEYDVLPAPQPARYEDFLPKAQQILESNVATKEKSDKATNIILACVLFGLICSAVYLVCVF